MQEEQEPAKPTKEERARQAASAQGGKGGLARNSHDLGKAPPRKRIESRDLLTFLGSQTRDRS